MNDAYKRETVIGFTCWDLNTKWVHPKSKHKDAKREIRKARRKNKEKMKNLLDNNKEWCYNKFIKKKGEW